MTKRISIGHILTRDAMKNLKGGKRYVVSCTVLPGYSQIAKGSCSGSQSDCQAAANSFCANTAGCSSCGLA